MENRSIAGKKDLDDLQARLATPTLVLSPPIPKPGVGAPDPKHTLAALHGRPLRRPLFFCPKMGRAVKSVARLAFLSQIPCPSGRGTTGAEIVAERASVWRVGSGGTGQTPWGVRLREFLIPRRPRAAAPGTKVAKNPPRVLPCVAASQREVTIFESVSHLFPISGIGHCHSVGAPLTVDQRWERSISMWLGWRIWPGWR